MPNMKKQVSLTIDGRKASVPAGSTILDAAAGIGIEIPTLCHHESIPPFASCFLCLVEIDGRPNPAPSCSTAAAEGMVVHTQTENIRSARKMCLELLLSDHCGDCVAPCSLACPAGCDVEKFISHIERGRNDEALRVLGATIVLPGTLGRICPRPCETKCRRARVDEPLTIGWLHRYAADAGAAQSHLLQPGTDTGKRVAVVGAGPAGMAAACFLRRQGHAVTVFEAEPEPGGMLAWGIPDYRLPRAELAKELQSIIEMGVEMRFGVKLGADFSIADLRKEGFNAVFIAVGAQISTPMRIDGEDLPGVLGGIELLRRTARGEKVAVGDKVIVVGGGNTAIDAARTACRLGAGETTLLYRRTCAEMPALPVEIEEARREGVEFRFLAAPAAILRRDGRLSVRCQQMKLGDPDASGRRSPVPVEGEVFDLDADTVVAAIGQAIDPGLLEREGVELDRGGKTIAVDPQTLQTKVPDVFAGGDAVARDDKRIAAWAVGSGKLASAAIDQFLKGQPVTGFPALFNSTMGDAPEDVTASRFDGVEKAPRAVMPELEPGKRAGHFDEVELGFTHEAAAAESKRCLECGCAAEEDCKLRKFALEYGADADRFPGAARDYTVDRSIATVVLEQGKCINCGICVRMADGDPEEGIFGFVERGFATRVKPYLETSKPEKTARLSQSCAEACPTGAIAGISNQTKTGAGGGKPG